MQKRTQKAPMAKSDQREKTPAPEVEEAAGEGKPRVSDRRRIYMTEKGEVGEAAEEKEAAGGEERPRYPRYVEELQRKVAAAEEKLQEHIERMNRESADFRSRQERELERRTAEIRKQLASGFLNIADDLVRATAAAGDSAAGSSAGKADALEALVQGIQLIQGRFFQELASLGVVPFDSEGERFDPLRHEAVGVVAVEEPAQDGVVVEEVSQGYLIGEEVLRPSKVRVGRHETSRAG